MDIPKWMMRDPAIVCERLEQMRQAKDAKETRKDKAARQIKDLFKETPDEPDNK